MKTLFIFVLILYPALVSPLWAATYYVDQSHSRANNLNAGTESDPWLTIQKAADVAKAGDTVLVKAGLYNEWIEIKNSGSAGMPITFKAYPGSSPIIDGTGLDIPDSPYDKALIYMSGKSYITIDGFEVRNSDEVLIRARAQDGNSPRVSNIIVRNSKIHGNFLNGHNGLDFTWVDNGLIEFNECYDGGWNCFSIVSCNNVDTQYNYIHNNPAHAGINIFPSTLEAPQGLYRGNDVLYNVVSNIGNPGAAIYLRYQTDNVIMGNLVNGNTSGIVLDFDRNTATMYTHAANTMILNNTIANSSAFGFRSLNATHVTLKNNIFAYNTSADIEFDTGTTIGSSADYNLYYSGLKLKWGASSYTTLSSWITNTGNDQHSLEANPGFIDMAASNYALTSASSAIDAGTDVSSYGLVSDLRGYPRPQGRGYDIGAYEYGAVKTLSGLTIQGPTNVNENSSATYTATAVWSDGTTSALTPLWNEDSPYATISSSGVLTSLSITANQTVTVSASYTSGGITKTATQSVSIIASIEPPAAAIPAGAIETLRVSITTPMRIVSSPDAPGGSYIETITSNAGSAVYSFSVAQSGIYKIVGETFAAGTGSDSFIVKIDNGVENIWDLNPKADPSLFNVWRQDAVSARGTGTFDAPQFDPFTVQLAAGSHTITFIGREPLTKLAYAYLLKEPTPEPTVSPTPTPTPTPTNPSKRPPRKK